MRACRGMLTEGARTGSDAPGCWHGRAGPSPGGAGVFRRQRGLRGRWVPGGAAGGTPGQLPDWASGQREPGAGWMAPAQDCLMSFRVPHPRRNRTALSRPREPGKCAAVANKLGLAPQTSLAASCLPLGASCLDGRSQTSLAGGLSPGAGLRLKLPERPSVLWGSGRDHRCHRAFAGRRQTCLCVGFSQEVCQSRRANRSPFQVLVGSVT